MDRYRPNYFIILTAISMVLIIASSITNHAVAELGLLISGWVVLFGAIVMYILKIKKEDNE